MADGATGKIKPLGDLKRPVRAGEAFAKLVSGASGQDLTPSKVRETFWSLADDGETMVSKVLGRVMAKNEGVLVRPLWTLSKDRTLLTVAVYPTDYMDRPLTAADISTAVSEGASYPPIDAETLEAAVARAAETGEPQPGCILAKGTPPVHGRDAKLRLTFKREKDAGTMRSDGSMDFRERGSLNYVGEGDLLAVLYPATQGTPGEDIFGKPVQAVDGRQLQLKAGDGVETVQGKDETIEFRATAEGLPEFEHGVLRICETLELPGDVDMESGNVHSPHGSVLIKGGVRSGFTVEVGKDVTVLGMVEDAVIKAGGNVELTGGVHMDDKGLIESGGQITAKFMEHARIRCAGDVITSMDIVQCNIDAGGKVLPNNGQGNIIGGHVRSRAGVEAKEIGHETAVATTVEVLVRGPRGSELEPRLDALRSKLDRLERGVGTDALDALLHAPDEDRRILAELIKVKSDVTTEIKTVEKELEADMLEAQEQLSSVGVKATAVVHPGVTIRIAGKPFMVTETLGPTVFRWNIHNREIETV